MLLANRPFKFCSFCISFYCTPAGVASGRGFYLACKCDVVLANHYYCSLHHILPVKWISLH